MIHHIKLDSGYIWNALNYLNWYSNVKSRRNQEIVMWKQNINQNTCSASFRYRDPTMTSTSVWHSKSSSNNALYHSLDDGLPNEDSITAAGWQTRPAPRIKTSAFLLEPNSFTVPFSSTLPSVREILLESWFENLSFSVRLAIAVKESIIWSRTALSSAPTYSEPKMSKPHSLL